MRENTVKFISV